MECIPSAPGTHRSRTASALLLKLTYLLNWVLSTDPLGFHMFNLAIHLINVILVYLFCKDVTQGSTQSDEGFPENVALIAAFLFAVHPVQTEAVTYISGRSVSLMTLWYVASALCYMRGTRTARPVLYAFISPVLFLCAVLTKEAALTLPLALLVWELLINKAIFSALARRQAVFWILCGGMFCLAVMNDRYFTMLRVDGHTAAW